VRSMRITGFKTAKDFSIVGCSWFSGHRPKLFELLHTAAQAAR